MSDDYISSICAAANPPLAKTPRNRTDHKVRLHWSEADIERVIRLHQKGYSFSGIESELGRTTREAVAGLIFRLKKAGRL